MGKVTRIGKTAAILALAAVVGYGAVTKYRDHLANQVFESGLRIEQATVHMKDGKTHEFHLEVAETPVDIQVGLMFRKHLPKNQGMLFIMHLDEPRLTSFWMKNTLIPLDMLFVGRDGTILSIHRMAQPESLQPISSVFPITAVIEIGGGRAEELGIEIGDRVEHLIFSK